MSISQHLGIAFSVSLCHVFAADATNQDFLTYSVNSCVLAQYTRCALCCLQPCILFVLNGCQVKIVLMIAYQWYQGDVCLYFGRSHQDQPVFQNHIMNMFCSQCHYLPNINKKNKKKQHLSLRHHTLVIPPAVLHRGTAEAIAGGMMQKLPFMPQGARDMIYYIILLICWDYRDGWFACVFVICIDFKDYLQSSAPYMFFSVPTFNIS